MVNDVFATCNVVTLDTKTEKDVTVEGRSSGANSNEAIDVISRVELSDDWLYKSRLYLTFS